MTMVAAKAATAPPLKIERWPDTNRAAGGLAKIRCSSDRDAVII
jgi:hypothetical protein